MAIYTIDNLDQLASLLNIPKMVDTQAYRKAIMEGIHKRGDDFWNKLPRRVQQWHNLNVDLYQSGHPFIDLPKSQKVPTKLGGVSRDSSSVHSVLIDALLANPFLSNKELWNLCMEKHVLTSLNTISQYAGSIRGVLRALEERNLIQLPEEPPTTTGVK